MQYFDLPTIKAAIVALEGVSANWLIPAFVFAANDVGTGELVDISKAKGTDQFLDQYFNGSLIGLPAFKSGNNLMRPRLKGVKQEYAGDFVIRQDTKMWGNLFSSRGYREMRQRGELEGEKANVRLTEDFQASFEQQIPATFEFEDFLVWLFAFQGFPDQVQSWQDLLSHLLKTLEIDEFQVPYRGRFKLTPGKVWPATIQVRPANEQFQAELAPGIVAALAAPPPPSPPAVDAMSPLGEDDPVLATVRNAIARNTGRSFLLAGPPGTGKTHLAHQLAATLTSSDSSCILFLQFHPAFGYDDFVEGFRPAETVGSNGAKGVTYLLEPRHFLKFAGEAAKPENSEKLFVVVIDELNRGDVARIFGELLTYLELDYRDKEFTLAISGKPTKLPRNLVLIATANPFDRSVTDLDDALLRRFIVIMMEPDQAFLEAHLKSAGVENRVLKRTLHLFKRLNEELPVGFGHTNFLKVRTIEDLAEVWTGRVQLGLQRALFHERQRYEAIRGEIEQLLAIDEEAEEEAEGIGENDAAPG